MFLIINSMKFSRNLAALTPDLLTMTGTRGILTQFLTFRFSEQ